MNINQIIKELEKNGFQSYGDFSHPDSFEYKGINQCYFTCLSGKYDGDVVELWYNWQTGEITKKSTYSQFYNCEPKFKF